MDSSNINEQQPTNIAFNSTYAEALSKGKSNDSSNNNPSFNKESMNGNIPLPRSSAIMDDATTYSNTPDSMSDSFEDAEDSQIEVQSLPTTYESVSDPKVVYNGESEASALNSEENQNVTDVNETVSYDCNSADESDLEDNTSDSSIPCPAAMRWKLRSENPEADLPSTVTVLDGENGAKVYLVGTAHFSMESQEDVAKTIRAVQPDIVVIELCNTRIVILSLDEQYILEEAKNMNFQKIRSVIQQNGFLQGILHCLLLSMSAHCTKQLGMPPGGEFKRAYEEATKIPGCIVHLGDRPIHITLQRALAKLTAWQKIKIGWHMLHKEPITKEDVERCKQKDLLEEMLAEMVGEFPEFSHVFVKERDIYLTMSLQIAAHRLNQQIRNAPYPARVVGVVGIGHVPGIQKNWLKVKDEDIPPILCIPEQTLTSKIIRTTLRATFYCAVVYGAYRIFPKSLIPSKVKSVLQDIPKTGLNKIFGQRFR